MKQQLQTIGGPDSGQDRCVPKPGFAVLFALARRPLTSGELCASLRMGVGECDRLLDELHQDYLIDVVSQLDGN